MAEFSRSKKASSGLFLSKKGSGLSSRDASNNRDQDTPVCSRVGCSSRMSSSNSTNVGFSNKAKSSKQPFHLSTNNKEIIGSSSKPSPSNGQRKLCSDRRRKLPYQQATDLESSNPQDESHVSEPVFTPDNSRTQLCSQPQNQVSKESIFQEASSSSLTPHSRNSKNASGKHESGDHTTSFSPPSVPVPYRSGSYGARSGASTSRYNFKNLKCNSMSDVGTSGCSSSSEVSHGCRRELGRKRNGEAESSSSTTRGKKMSESMVDDRKVYVSHRGGISISDSRRARNLAANGRDNNSSNGVRSSARAQRSTARASLIEQESRNRLQCTDSSILGPLLTLPDMPPRTNASSLNYQFPALSSSNRRNFSGRPGSGSESVRSGRTIAPFGVVFGRSFTSRENLRNYNLDGITEMLLALDTIDQDEELTYEQLLVLETNLFLGGLSFHDQHRDMRLDIDNMSYEELLALEERMGTVSTALSEEALEKCLEKAIFQGSLTVAEERAVISEDGDDIQCSICQEEYSDGDEVGRLGCEHRYHVECISQWLRLKNWCPICKTSAQRSESLSSASPSAPPPPLLPWLQPALLGSPF